VSRVQYARAAVSDIDRIWDYTFETWGIDQAERYTIDIREACNDLASGRKIGRAVEARPGYFRYGIARHVIFFIETEEGIVVMRVLHQRMDVERYLGHGER
jgi:toxin ParE1/3/4